MRLKIELIICVVVFVIGFSLGVWLQSPTPMPSIQYTQGQAQSTQVESPQGKDYDILYAWANDPIVIYRNLSDKGLLTIQATDGHKQTTVTDSIVQQSKPRRCVVFSPFVYARGLSISYGVGAGYFQEFGRALVGGQIFAARNFVALSASAGFSF